MPTNIPEANRLDFKNGDTLWADAIDREMHTLLPALDIIDAIKPPPGYLRASGHLIFDVKMDFTRKARWVKNGHLTKDPIDSNFAGVVLQESTRIALNYAAVNGLNVAVDNIKSAYLQAPKSKKYYIICDDAFPLEFRGKIALIK